MSTWHLYSVFCIVQHVHTWMIIYKLCMTLCHQYQTAQNRWRRQLSPYSFFLKHKYLSILNTVWKLSDFCLVFYLDSLISNVLKILIDFFALKGAWALIFGPILSTLGRWVVDNRKLKDVFKRKIDREKRF